LCELTEPVSTTEPEGPRGAPRGSAPRPFKEQECFTLLADQVDRNEVPAILAQLVEGKLEQLRQPHLVADLLLVELFLELFAVGILLHDLFEVLDRQDPVLPFRPRRRPVGSPASRQQYRHQREESRAGP
jgi:hypothetical protein